MDEGKKVWMGVSEEIGGHHGVVLIGEFLDMTFIEFA